MDKLLVSMMRFSTAMTLFGVQQMETAMNTVSGGEDINDSMEKFCTALDSFSEAVSKSIDDSKMETLDSVTRVCEDTLKRAMDGIGENMTDPREAFKSATDMMRKATDSATQWMNCEKSDSSAGASSSSENKTANASA